MLSVRNPRLLLAVLAGAGLLLVAACGDGGVQEQRDAERGGELSTDLAQLRVAVNDLEVRIAGLELAIEELVAAARPAGGGVSDLPALIEELQLRLDALDGLGAGGSDEATRDEDPCAFLAIYKCPEANQVPRP